MHEIHTVKYRNYNINTYISYKIVEEIFLIYNLHKTLTNLCDKGV